MKSYIVRMLIAGIILSLTGAKLALADTFYVSDELQITMRSGPGIKNKIKKMLKSGVELEALEQNGDGYSKVRDLNGTTGWVLTRFLMNTPSARARLEKIKQHEIQLEDANVELESLRLRVTAQQEQLDTLSAEKEKTQNELDKVNQVAADTLAINDQNQLLTASLAQAESAHTELLGENTELKQLKDQTWFLYGAAVIFLGMVIGLVIPKLRFRRNRKWGDYSSYG